ncbi:MAG: pimeloyl-[acyl-carrier protein] methyl ester esterase [Paraglaciecola sp.]|jgi:pimeloyl-[acyl-carrier protein] methyl ester esterase
MKMCLQSTTQGRGPALVLLHGWGVNSGVWQPIASQLERNFRVTYIDLPGFGMNANVKLGSYSVQSVADMVSKCLPAKCHLLGWSLGGLVAQQIAVDHPAKIEQLLLVATSPKFVKTPDWPGIEPRILDAFAQQLQSDFNKTLDRFLAIQAMGSDSAKSDIKLIKKNIQQYPMAQLDALQGGLQILGQTDLRGSININHVAVHWMLGQLDSLVPIALTEYLDNRQPEHSYHIFQHASHAPFISHPEEFIANLVATVKGKVAS